MKRLLDRPMKRVKPHRSHPPRKFGTNVTLTAEQQAEINRRIATHAERIRAEEARILAGTRLSRS